uniref:Uncharacterized protein n=1 Tax=Arundo donax TaxID=35708 RepID=A0A0A9GQ81_ARUDO
MVGSTISYLGCCADKVEFL